MLYYCILQALLMPYAQDDAGQNQKDAKAIKDALLPRPSSVEVSYLKDKGQTEFKIDYTKEDNLGYEELGFRAFVKGEYGSPVITVQSSYHSGSVVNSYKQTLPLYKYIAVYKYDGHGKRSPEKIVEKDKAQLTKIEKRSDEIRNQVAKWWLAK